MKIKSRWYDWALTGLALAALLASTLYIIICWRHVPDNPPTHYDFRGIADGWGNNKTVILMSPVLAWFMFGLMSLVERFPSAWNTMDGIRPANVPRALRLSKTLIGITKCAISLNFAWISFCTARGADLGALTMPLFLGGLFVPVLVILVMLFRLR